MGEPPVPQSLFLAGLAAAYLAAFTSLYVQIPGLYGRDGVLPARRLLRPGGRGLWEQLRDTPTLLWLGPRLGLDTEQGMELLSLAGALGALGALVLKPLRSCPLFALLWLLYLSLYQVGQVFLYFQWDSLLLETGLLAVLVAPLWAPWGGRWVPRGAHAAGTFWLVRWLLLRLMFGSGVGKLSSRCPAWWGLTALNHHYQTQCIPTPGAWFAHQLPSWVQKLSVVGTFLIEIPVPLLFLAPLRRLRLFAFYCQVLLQILIILTGNYNFFNLLTLTLATSLLDEEHVGHWLGQGKRRPARAWPPSLCSCLCALLEIGTYSLLLYWGIQFFGLEIDWEKKLLDAKVAFTYHEFTTGLSRVMLPLVGLASLSLAWELLTGLYRCARARGWLWKLWALLQWGIFTAATLAMFALSLVPFTSLSPGSSGQLWPGLQRLFSATQRLQPVHSYGLFRRMTGLGGRPEVVLEGSYDRHSWTEIEFMYKPGNVSRAPPFVAPHQPRLDWQMWFAALGHHSSSPWFTSFVHRLLQGKEDVIRLLQLDESQYPFSARPPTYIRAQLYKYWFTSSAQASQGPAPWWHRQHVQEFYPPVSLGDPTLEALLDQYGLKDRPSPRPPAVSLVPRLLRSLRQLSRPFSGCAILASLYLVAGSALLLQDLARAALGGSPPARHKGPRRGDPGRRGAEERAEGRARGGSEGQGVTNGDGRTRGVTNGHGDGLRGGKKKK